MGVAEGPDLRLLNSRKPSVARDSTVNYHMSFAQLLIPAPIKDIPDETICMRKLITISKSSDHVRILEEGLQLRDQGDIAEYSPSLASLSVLVLLAKWTPGEVLVLRGICDAGIDAAIKVGWRNARED